MEEMGRVVHCGLKGAIEVGESLRARTETHAFAKIIPSTFAVLAPVIIDLVVFVVDVGIRGRFSIMKFMVMLLGGDGDCGSLIVCVRAGRAGGGRDTNGSMCGGE